jgi:hypothetical protein
LAVMSCCFGRKQTVLNDTYPGKCDIWNLSWELQHKQRPTGPSLTHSLPSFSV